MGLVKVWDIFNCRIECKLLGHTGYLNTIAVSPDGSLCASGGNDTKIIIWDLVDNKKLYQLFVDAGEIVNALCFNPNRYYLCAGTQRSIKIWDLKSRSIIANNIIQDSSCICKCLSWSFDGSLLFSGQSDGKILVFSSCVSESLEEEKHL